MDYIQQAIDKAREERQSKIGNADADGEASQASEPSRLTAPRDEKGVPQGINYTQTQTQELSSKILKDNRIVASLKGDQRTEHYRQLRTQVIQKMRANSWKSLAITSPNENAGKSTTAVNLAISLSKEVNQTVLLVDLNLRNPSVAQLMGIPVENGLIDHLINDVPVSELLINPGLERLVILPGREDSAYSSEMLSGPAMKSLVEDLTSRYESRIIIFDLPALLVNDDALAFIPAVDSALMVVENGKTTEEEIKRSLELLEGTSLLGTLLNKLD